MRAQLTAALVLGSGLIVLTDVVHPRATALPTDLAQSCTLADEEFWAPRPIDDSSCEADGSGDPAHRAQNTAKNNLCAGGFLTATPSEEPALVTQKSFIELEKKARTIRTELGLSEGHVPEADDRKRLRNDVYTSSEGDELAEGKLVRYVGFLLEGHYSGAEGVNCGRTRQANADVHLAFSQQKPSQSMTAAKAEALECGSITAEILPRRRPEDWAFLGRMRKTTGPLGLRGALEKIRDQDLHRPLRITGQLFFDGSHRVCNNGQKISNQPPRASNWEIHPVYAIDVEFPGFSGDVAGAANGPLRIVPDSPHQDSCDAAFDCRRHRCSRLGP